MKHNTKLYRGIRNGLLASAIIWAAFFAVLFLFSSVMPTPDEYQRGRGNAGELQRAAEQAWELEQAQNKTGGSD